MRVSKQSCSARAVSVIKADGLKLRGQESCNNGSEAIGKERS